MTEWSTGDVGLTAKGRLALRRDDTPDGWIDSQGAPWSNRKFPNNVRPLVVIDPEDREAVERLLEFLHRAEDSAHPAAYCGSFTCRTDSLREALREFANPKPPKPDEPLGLGAVVEDVVGNRWVRTIEAHIPWYLNDSGGDVWRDYDAILAVKVLSEGVPVE